MKKVEMYECEICNETYRTKQEALECESIGKEIPLYSVGDFVERDVHVSGGFGVFKEQLMISKVKDKGHFIYYELSSESENGIWDYEDSFYIGNDRIQECINTGANE
ncbi:hypothetical protein M3649_03925 [Ureibacillus chungkukjangi]|uniref:hypothetical protein n=1 Tax=Ureibacillus chungkukjangi TaxID=1202712 RepID=UPI00203E29F8|nr:hypothetical protein [Ureibacillus chungkukjangi]MCM3387280.1 hypothetical protein [Ureibacillus chungkukjangi]